MSKVLLSREEVMKYLPHRDPFLFIDEVTTLSLAHLPNWTLGEVLSKDSLVGIEVRCSFNLASDRDIFRGHFPGNPIFPGVLQLEMMAQCACLGTIPLSPNLDEAKISVALGKIEEAKFRRPIAPPARLEVVARCDKIRGSMMGYTGEIYLQGQLMSESKGLAFFNDLSGKRNNE